MTEPKRLITKSEYDKLTPREQGYVHYMQADWPGSELKRVKCGYPPGSDARKEWDRGQLDGVLEAQDLDD